MDTDQDLQQPDDENSTTPSQNPSPAGQSNNVDWENRFKGLQRTYNQLQQDLQSKDAYATQVTQQYQQLESQLTETQVRYEGQLNETKATLATAQEESATKDERISELESQLATAQSRDNIRRELTQRHGDLLSWFESGYLTVPDGEDGKPLSGEGLDTYLNGFREQLGQNATSAFQQTMSGTTPPQFGTASGVATGMTKDQMADWLSNPSNINHPDHERINEAYIVAIEGNMGGNNQTTDWLNR